MSGYTNVFQCVFDGSLGGKWPALPVWITLLAMCDKHGHIDKTHDVISRASGWPVDLLRTAIDELMQPDPSSRSQREGGRRLVRIDPNREWGWRVVNRDIYRQKAAKNEYELRGRKYRDDLRSDPMTSDDSRSKTTVRDRVIDRVISEVRVAQSQTQLRRTRKPDGEPVDFQEIRKAYPQRAGGQRWGDAVRAYRKRIAEGVTHAVILAGVQRYAAHAQAMGLIRTAHVQQAATFLGDNRGYLEEWPIEQRDARGRPAAGRVFRDDDRSLDGLDL